LFGTLLLIIAAIGLGGFYPSIIQEFVVRPNEVEKELPYIRHHTAMTRAAYGLDRMEPRSFDVQQESGPEVIGENPWISTSIRLWDWRPLMDTYAQIQSLRPYYD